MGNKEGQSFEDDLSKERWYLNKSKELLKLVNVITQKVGSGWDE